MNDSPTKPISKKRARDLKRRALRQPLETAITRIGFKLVPRLPRSGVNLLARISGTTIYLFAWRMRNIGLTNLDIVFGDQKTAAEKKQILRHSMIHFVRSTLDLFWFSRDTEARCTKYVRFDASFDKIMNRDPALALTGHLGNWEVMGIAYAHLGHIIMSVAAPLKNPTVDQLFIETREKTGQTIIPQAGAIRKIMSGLKKGGKMAVLLDQNTRLRDGGVFIDFCGKQVLVSPAPAAIAIKAKAPVHVVYCLPDMNGYYTGSSPDEVTYPPDISPQELTQKMSNAFKEAILANPQCWLWTYKRFKYRPPEADPADYPAYSKSV